MKNLISLLLIFISLNVQAQVGKSTIIVKTKPWQTFPIHARSPLEIETPLHYNNNLKADKDGNYKVEFEIDKPFFIEFSNILDNSSHIIFLAQKNRVYYVDPTKTNPVTCNVDSALFINEIAFYDNLDGEHSLNNSPQFSNDTINSHERIMMEIFKKMGETQKQVDSSIKNFGFQFDKPINSEIEYFIEIEKYYKRRIDELEKANLSKSVSPEFYTYFKRFFYLRLLEDKIHIKPIDKKFKYESTQTNIDNAYKEIETLFKCDSCVDFLVYSSIMEQYIYRKIYKESNYRTVNEEIYDYIKNETKFSEKVKNFLLTQTINNEIFIAKNSTHIKYLEKYSKDCTSDYYKNITNNRTKRQGDYLTDEITKSIKLERTNGPQVTLYDILQKHKGKTVYIDVWASWCKPCRENMHHTKDLIKASAKSNFVVLFFSVDQNKNAWIKASNEELIDANNNYILEGGTGSKLCNVLDIFEVPRFILIGKDGKLLAMKAIDAYSMYDKKFYE